MIRNLNSLLEDKSISEVPFVLKGLVKASVGMLIAAPSAGKSHLALSIAMEHASSATILGLSCSETPKKVLIVSSEDGSAVLRERMTEKVKLFSSDVQTELLNNLFFLTDETPIITPPDAYADEQSATSLYVDNLVQSAIDNDVDLIIVDTVTEAVGSCDEVKHDKHIKAGFQAIARRTGASILLVHHVNKNEIRGEQEVTMASGAGLSSVMRLVKFMITIKAGKNNRVVQFLKSNYLPQDEEREFEVDFVEGVLSRKGILSLGSTSKKKTENPKIMKSIQEEPEVMSIKPDPNQKISKESENDLRDVL
ncbi:helicase RepA family protein (plasmid) [Vibrio parahaemolyticus]|nr:helicase RepA family protein [Vibrio parahaemolyticus]